MALVLSQNSNIYNIFRKVHKFVVHEFVNRYLADFSAKVRRTCQ